MSNAPRCTPFDTVVDMLHSVSLEIIPSDYEVFVKRTYVLPAYERNSGLIHQAKRMSLMHPLLLLGDSITKTNQY
jgi:hypothetical protein